jgi:hypothetical protein
VDKQSSIQSVQIPKLSFYVVSVMSELGISPHKYEEWVEDDEDLETKNRNSKTIESLIESLIERDSIDTSAKEQLDVQFYSIILPIFFFFFVSEIIIMSFEL